MSAVSSGPGRLLLVGGGNMGGAMLRGWVDFGLPADDLHVVDPQPGEALRALIAEGRLRHSTTVPTSPFDVVVLAVKPQVMGDILPNLAPALTPETLVISVAAGKTIAFIAATLGERPIVRAMPNTPALIGRGITGCFANPLVTPALRDKAEALLSASGAVVWVEAEADIDAVTAVSGSGPAYVFHLTEALAAAGEAMGLAPDLAMTLARHTVAGAGELMIQSPEAPAQLRRNVTSPNGTTQAALDVLMAEDGLGPLMRHAVTAARDRARELSKD
ncbi:pyrroline-5-carboxylate reductase [Aureimonas glaciei]|uniref:Pyrroline-5-carboxylate reductase n=1 Tax=Aureimonas glaciei TaxID=1776957 RepID=A0A917DDM9_9HYPH|nr:pyrroline-5-carboxylate reductase [Aureimonas glaciei]GGD28371.1 pyrroline-5-carboxylate reductase [Aureimonas glaciei]